MFAFVRLVVIINTDALRFIMMILPSLLSTHLFFSPRPSSLCIHQRVGVLLLSEMRVEKYEPHSTPKSSAMNLESRLAQLSALQARHGFALPTSDHADPSLPRWAARQRTLHRKGLLSAEIIAELDAVDFIWDPQQAAWEAHYETLETFHEEHGHCNVPSTYAASPALPGWISRQRRLHKLGTLHADRVAALELLDFSWDPAEARWEGKLAEYSAALAAWSKPASLRARMPAPLGQWAARQRRAWREGRLSAERIEALQQMPGWTWAPPTAQSKSALLRLGQRLAREAGSANDDDRPSGELLPAEGTLRPPCLYRRCSSVGRALLVSMGARREDAASELQDAREALRALGYTVVTVQNPSVAELHTSIAAHAAMDDWGNHASSVVALMGHGHGARLECQCGESTPLRALFGLLAPRAAPALRGKPKIFLVQACRGGEAPVLVHSEEATAATRGEGGGGGGGKAASRSDGAAAFESAVTGPVGGVDGRSSAVDAAAAAEVLSDEHDFLWAFATVCLRLKDAPPKCLT